MGVINRLRQPAYTGANRCDACTAVNLVLAVLLAIASAAAGSAGVSVPAGALLGSAVLALSVVSIWLRGYLVPGTPELTKRHMPVWMLAWFGKAPAHQRDDGPLVEEDEQAVDTEELLVEHDIVEPCQDGEELCLTDPFVSDWENERVDSGTTIDADAVAVALGIDSEGDDIDLEESDDGNVKFLYDGSRLAIWPSPAAARADLVSGTVLSEWVPDWREFYPYKRALVFKSVRIFLDRCPDGDDTELREDVLESCCSTHDVLAVVCSESRERLVEQPVQ